jgi:hypothetical protein
MHEEAADAAGTAIEVFVTAPGCEIDVPFVEFER